MVSRDLTCNETMPPLDDGDNLLDLHHQLHNAFNAHSQMTISQSQQQHQQGTSKSISNCNHGKNMNKFVNAKASAVGGSITQQSPVDFGYIDASLNHTTTVRDVVTRNIRNRKLSVESPHLAGYPKLGGILSSIGHIDGPEDKSMLPLNHKHQIVNNLTNVNGCVTMDHRHYNHVITTTIQEEGDMQYYAILSPSTSPNSSNNINQTSHAVSSTQIHIPKTNVDHQSGSTFYGVRQPTNAAAYYLKTAKDAYITPPIADQHTQNSTGTTTMTASSSSTIKQQQMQWAIHPPINSEHAVKGQLQPQTTKINGQHQSPTQKIGVLRSAISGSEANSPHKMGVPAMSDHVYSPSQQSYGVIGTSTNHRHQQSPQPHTSPRPSILRGNTAVRRLADRERPASVSTVIMGTCVNGATEGRLSNCPSRGAVEDSFMGYGHDDSPRKRLRKQQFDNNQLAPDKLRMEVMAAQRFEQTSSAGSPFMDWPENAAPSSSHIIQQRSVTHAADPTETVGAILCGKTVSEKGLLYPKKRGRPKMNCRTQQLPLTASKNTSKISSVYMASPHSSGSNQQQEQLHQQSTVAVDAIKPVMVDVDSLLHTDLGLKKRKYRKRTPVIDPSTGEFVKKVRKKGSGRKSKKVLEEALQQQLTTASSPISVQHVENSGGPRFDGQMLQNVELMVQSAEERDVIQTLCRFKRDWDKLALAAELKPSTSNNCATTEHAETTRKKHRQKHFKALHNNIPLTHSPSKIRPLSLLTDLSELRALRPLLRRCERSMNPTDNCYLSESFEELDSFMQSVTICYRQTNSDSSKQALNFAKHLDDQIIERLNTDFVCPIFSDYSEFKNCVNSLRLLPLGCAYFDASQRLLDILRNSLLGVSLYQTLQNYIQNSSEDDKNMAQMSDVAESTTLISLTSNGPFSKGADEGEVDEKERELRQSRAFFDSLISGFSEEACLNEKKKQLEVKFLLQLDVAQTLNSLLNCVERNIPLQECRQDSSLCDKVQSSIAPFTENDCSTMSGPVHTNFKQFMTSVPSDLHRTLFMKWPHRSENQKGRIRKRKIKLSSDDDVKRQRMLPSDKDDRIEEEKSFLVRQSEFLLSSIERLRTESYSENVLLDSISQRLCNLDMETRTTRNGPKLQRHCSTDTPSTSSSSLLDLPRQESSAYELLFRRKRNPHKSRQFVYCPPDHLIKELFKNIPIVEQQRPEETSCANGLTIMEAPQVDDHQQEEDQSPLNPSNSQEARRKDMQRENSPTNKGQLLLKGDLDEIVASCSNVAAYSFDQLRYKYPVFLQCNAKDKPHIMSTASASKSKNGNTKKTDSLSTHLFTPSLRFRYPVSSTADERMEFLKDRFREIREICTTTVGLTHSRATLMKQCVDSMREVMEKLKQRIDVRDEETNKIGVHRHCQSKTDKQQSKQPQLRVYSLEEEEHEEDEDERREDGTSSPVQQQHDNRQNCPITKRTARKRTKRALGQPNSSSRSVSSSRSASRDRSLEAKRRTS